MALCEGQLDSALPLAREDSSPRSEQETPEKKPALPNGDVFGPVPGVLPLGVDYRSPVSHFVPPELFARQKTEQLPQAETSAPATPPKRKRGRPRVDKTSPEYLANLAARKQAREMAAMINARNDGTPPGEKRKRGRPRVDKTSPEYLARKRAREIEALERKAKREYRRRTTGVKVVKTTNKVQPTKKVVPTKNVATPKKVAPTKKAAARVRKLPSRLPTKVPPAKLPGKKVGNPRKLPSGKTMVRKVGDRKVVIRRATKFVRRKDSAASSSGESPRVKRKYTKRAPGVKKTDVPGGEKVKGKRGRPRKADQSAPGRSGTEPKIRVRSNLMPNSTETITLDSDEEPDIGSPSQASDSLSLDENLRALRHIHEKYANIDKDDIYEAHLLAANVKKPAQEQRLKDDDEVLSIRSSEGNASVKDIDRVEKLEDSSNSDSDSSSSGSGSSSSSSSSSSGSSSSSDTSDSESDNETAPAAANNGTSSHANNSHEDDRSFGAWSYSNPQSGSESDSDPERNGEPIPRAELEAISESDNESSDKSFQCHICRKWYSTRVTLKIHRRSHQSRGGGNSRSRTRSSDRYECDCCNETFNRREKMWEHKAAAHRGAMTSRCEVCRKCFEDDAELAAHDRMHTDDERAGRCSSCGATFPRWDQLRRHRAAAHQASSASTTMPHACHLCGKRFTHPHSLTRHMQNHAKQLYRCVVCKASFARADQLAQHLNSHLANYKRLKP